jgi:hypothetical protein
MGIRVVPNETIPAAVARHLKPDERRVITVRRHPMLPMLCALPLLAVVADYALHATGAVHGHARSLHILAILIVPCACLLLCSGMAWLGTYFVVTSERLLICGWWRYRRFREIPLSAAVEMSFVRTGAGRLFGYGFFRMRRPGSRWRMLKINFLPYPEQLYLETIGLIFRDPGAENPPGL